MSISRWDPLGDMVGLREAMGNLLEESFVRPRQGAAGPGTDVSMALDVHETPEAFVVAAALPGVGADDVDVTVLGDTLRISGRRQEERRQGAPGGRWLLREQRFGAFSRAVRLPTEVKADAVSAEFRDGVLTVTLPKAETARPQSIPVRAASGGAGQTQAVEAASGQGEQPQSGTATPGS